MKGYIYTMYAGADPGHGWALNDPIFGGSPTLGACVPHIRRAIDIGDHIFVISGHIPGVRQFVVGGFQVAEKIDALAAYKRFPQHRLKRGTNGQILGNIIVDSRGKHHSLDDHDNFQRRIENYIVGRDPVVLTTPQQFKAGREETVDVLAEVFDKKGSKPFDIIGRHRKMDEDQVEKLKNWLKDLSQ
jgi:Nucleotide modification associated domain 2